MSDRVCIVNADASDLKYHRIGWFATVNQAVTRCGDEVSPLFGISSLQQARAKRLGAWPCARCFPVKK
jgi:hypothetical protein